MQVYAKSNREWLKTILFFILILFLAYLPIASFQFFIKNDAFSGYFPPKFFMSESLHAAQLPLWNPYINFGFPQYGDMSSGYWSPITWLMASTIGYNAYSFTLELLFYILLGGLGMYRLLDHWKINPSVKLIAGLAFMCSGYNIGHLQHFNWISGAAFLPWCLWAYLKMLEAFSLKKALGTALFFYFLISSAHPGISIAAAYFFLAISLFHYSNISSPNGWWVTCKAALKQHSIVVICLLLLSAGMLAGYVDILPHFVRGEKIGLEQSVGNPSNLPSWISVLLPFATVKNNLFFQTDISLRNSYFSISLFLFFLLAVFRSKSIWQRFILAIGLAYALLAGGGLFKTFAYYVMPGIGYVRLNGEFRIFSILCFIIVAAIELNKWMEQKETFNATLSKIYYALEIIVIACISFGLYKALYSKESILHTSLPIVKSAGIGENIKSIIDALSFYDCFWIQGTIQLFLLWGIKYALKFRKSKLLTNLVIVDIVLASLLNIPFTGVGKASLQDVQTVLNKSPKGIPIPALQPIRSHPSISLEEEGLTGDWSMYNKQLGVSHQVAYPIALNNTVQYFENVEKNPRLSFEAYPFLFCRNNFDTNTPDTILIQNSQPIINNFSVNSISFNINATDSAQVIYLESHYPHWYYNNGMEKRKIEKGADAFIHIPIHAGEQQIKLTFEPHLIKWMMLLSVVSFILACAFLLLFKQSSPSSQKPLQYP